jgi:hypothetical protein
MGKHFDSIIIKYSVLRIDQKATFNPSYYRFINLC